MVEGKELKKDELYLSKTCDGLAEVCILFAKKDKEHRTDFMKKAVTFMNFSDFFKVIKK